MHEHLFQGDSQNNGKRKDKMLTDILCVAALWLVRVTSLHAEQVFVSRGESSFEFANFNLLENKMLQALQIIAAVNTKDIVDCALECLKKESCQSVNYKDKLCDLLDATKYNNESALQLGSGVTHLFLKSACDLSPCRNGATCHPLHNNGSYRCACRLNYIGQMCEVCSGPALGIEDGRIKAAQMSQSSYVNNDPIYGPDRARLNLASHPYGAQLRVDDSDGGWFKIDLLNTHVITAFAMQGYGASGSQAYVTSFLISSSDDNSNWSSVEDTPGSPKIFPGNTDNTGILKTTFSPPVIGRYFKINTKTCSAYCTFRLEIYGCVKV